MHAPRGIFQNQTRNEVILNTPSIELVNNGYIAIERLETIIKNKAIYESIREDQREGLPDPIPNPWGLYLPNDTDNKKCHYWIWSKSPNFGKSTTAQELVCKYRGILKTRPYDWWTIRRDIDFMVLDEYRAGLRYDELNAICDGNYEFNMKNLQPIKLEKKPIVIVFANYGIRDAYPNMYELIESRFNEYELV